MLEGPPALASDGAWTDVDITELKLMILAVLERHGMGPEWRRCMRGARVAASLGIYPSRGQEIPTDIATGGCHLGA